MCNLARLNGADKLVPQHVMDVFSLRNIGRELSSQCKSQKRNGQGPTEIRGEENSLLPTHKNIIKSPSMRKLVEDPIQPIMLGSKAIPGVNMQNIRIGVGENRNPVLINQNCK